MSILLSRVSVVPTWFVVVGLVALSWPRIVPNGVLFLGIVVSAGARFWHIRSVPAAIQDERAQHWTFARWCRPISATGHPGRHRAGWAYETAYEGALEGGPRCCEFMTRPS